MYWIKMRFAVAYYAMQCCLLRNAMLLIVQCNVLNRAMQCIESCNTMYWIVQCNVLNCAMQCIELCNAMYWIDFKKHLSAYFCSAEINIKSILNQYKSIYQSRAHPLPDAASVRKSIKRLIDWRITAQISFGLSDSSWPVLPLQVSSCLLTFHDIYIIIITANTITVQPQI